MKRKDRNRLIQFYMARNMVALAMTLLPRLNVHEPLAEPVPHGPRDRFQNGIKPDPPTETERLEIAVNKLVKRIRGINTIAGAYPPGTPGRKKAKRRVRQNLRTNPILLPQ